MSDPDSIYVLDANVLVQAHRRWYGFAFHPGFWDFLLRMQQAGRVVSIDRVKDEILAGDELETWVSQQVPAAFFQSTGKQEVAKHFGDMMRWVHGSAQFKPEAKTEFATVADGWLAAYAKAHPNHVVVTHEEFSADAK